MVANYQTPNWSQPAQERVPLHTIKGSVNSHKWKIQGQSAIQLCSRRPQTSLPFLLLSGPPSATGLPLRDKMAVASSDFPSSDHINQETHPLLKNLSQKFKMLLVQQTPPVSLNTYFLWLNAMCQLMAWGEGFPHPISLIQSRTIPGCGVGSLSPEAHWLS